MRSPASNRPESLLICPRAAGPLRLPCAGASYWFQARGPLWDSPGAHLWCDSHVGFAAGLWSVRMDTSKTLPAFPLPEDLGWPCLTGGMACGTLGITGDKVWNVPRQEEAWDRARWPCARGCVCASWCICRCGGVSRHLFALGCLATSEPPLLGQTLVMSCVCPSGRARALCLCAALCMGWWTGTGHGAWLRAGAPIFLCWSVPSPDSLLGLLFSERGPVELVQTQAPSARPQ